MKRIAVDIGGTFTDIVYIDESSMEILVDKVQSTPWDIGQAVVDAIKKINADMSEVDLFIHGTTVGINTIVQKKGAKIGLISTKGFTDVLEMGRGNKEELYDYMWKKPKPLVPRYLRMGVNERTSHLGEVIRKLDEDEARDVINRLREHGIEAIAVCLLHSYANPENECKLGEIINEVWPGATFALSHQVAREIREYERVSTTVINAYIERAVVSYLKRLRENLEGLGFKAQTLVLGPSGVLGVDSVEEKAIQTLASGPIGGAAGAAYLAGLCGIRDLLTIDVGGTSFDVSVIKDGVNIEKHQTEIMGYPVLMAGMDIRPIGAGGGSIADVDEAGLLTVGPESAGANPGPMAYETGGTKPTVTDAALVNGLIDPGYFLGGQIRLNMDLARKGVGDVAKKIGLDLHETASGILSVARNNMTTATMEILVGQGFDPRDFSLISYGGAGGIFSAGLAEDMSISRIIIPPAPGVFSARGILAMNLVHTYTRAYISAFNRLDLNEVEDIYRKMEDIALRTLVKEGIPEKDVEFTRSMDICYEGQRYYIETILPGDDLRKSDKVKEKISESFKALYKIRYSHLIDAPLRTINTRLKATGKIKEIPSPEIQYGEKIPETAMKDKRNVYFEDKFVEGKVYERSGLLWGNIIDGPAIVEEPFHTTIVLPGQTLNVDKLGNLVIRAGGK
ncbi:MAG: hydantoinase/oxoprolinase family protein [Deltaproteobacteria bacterium]|nr:hydantoinase/oxoprolinase family protein [Deltaproteobacteria bacterium]